MAVGLQSATGAPGDKKWEFLTGGAVSSSPAIGADGTIYAGSQDKKVYALDGATGTKKWAFLTGGGVSSSPAIGLNGTVYVGSGDSMVYALDGGTGAKKWSFVTGGGVSSSPAIAADGTVYVGSQDQKIYALDGATGGRKWQFVTAGAVSSSPAIGPDGTVYVGSDDRKLYALDGATGSKKWDYVMGDGVRSSPAIGSDGTVYVGLTAQRICALDGATGAKRWEFVSIGQYSSSSSSPAIGADGTVYLGSGDTKVYALDGTSGTKKWGFASGNYWGFSSPAIGADGTVYIASGDKKVYALVGATGAKKWEFVAGGGVSTSPAIGPDGTVFVGSDDKKVYALEGSSALAESPWPMQGRNPRHQGSAEFAGLPQLVAQPLSQARALGGTITISVIAGGKRPLSYRWQKDGIDLINSDRVSGTDSSVLRLANLQLEDLAAYRVVVSNADGSITSTEAQLTSRAPIPGELRWVIDFGTIVEQFTSSPAIGGDGTVYVGSDDKKVYAVDGATAAIKWSFTTGDRVRSSPAIGADGTVYVGSDDKKVYALDGATGARKWAFTTGSYVESSPAIGIDGTIYIGSMDKKIYALDGTTGAKKWESTLGNFVISSPAVGPDGTLYVGSADVMLNALEGVSGARKWQFNAGASGYASYGCSAVIGADGTVYAGSEQPPYRVCALDGATGAKTWEFATGDSVYSSLAIGADGTVFAGAGTKVFALTGATGVKKWESVIAGEYGQTPFSSAIGADGTVYVGSYDKNVYALDGANGAKKWAYATGGLVRSSPALGADGTLYIGSDDGKLYALFTSGPLADSPWPMQGRNAKHQGSAEFAGPPQVLRQSVSQEGVLGSGVTFSVTAGGTLPLSYRWQKDGIDLENSAWVSGATTNVLQVFNLQPGSAGAYRVVVSNGEGSTTNLEAQLTLRTASPGEVRWVFKVDSWNTLSAAIGFDGTVYVGSFDTNLYALDGAAGVVKAKSVAADFSGFSFPPVIGPDGTVYGSSRSTIVALDGPSMVEKWVVWTGRMPNAAPAIGADGTLYVGLDSGIVRALDGMSGAMKWEFKTAIYCQMPSSPAIGADGTVYVGSSDYKIYALDGTTGTQRWEFATGGIIRSSPAIGADGTVYVGSSDYKIYALDGAAGTKKWEFETGYGVSSSPAIGGDGTVYVGSDDNKVYALDGATGIKKWQFATGQGVRSSPAIAADGTVYVGSSDDKLYALDGTTGGKKWEFVMGGTVDSSPAIGADGTVYIGSNGKVYALFGSSPLADSPWPMLGYDATHQARVGLSGPPRIIEQPIDQVGVLGGSLSIEITADGKEPLTYRWQKNGTDLTDTGRITGAGMRVLVVGNLQPGDDGVYRVVVSNVEGTATSEEAEITSRRAVPGELRWVAAAGPGWLRSSPAIGPDGTVYVGSGYNTNIFALNAATGAKKWQFGTGATLDSSPAIGADGTVYVGSTDKKVYALDGSTGAKKWEFVTGDVVASSPAVSADGMLYLGSRDKKVYALDAATGAKMWQFVTGGWVDSSPAIGANGTVYAGSIDGNVYALDGATGVKKWQAATDYPISPAIGTDGTVYVGGPYEVAYLDPATGTKKIRSWVSASSSMAIGVDGTVYVGSQDGRQRLGNVYALDARTAMTKWTFTVGKDSLYGDDYVRSTPAIGADGTVYVGAPDMKLYALDGATGTKKWEYATGGGISSSPAIGADGTVYVGSDDGKLYAVFGSSPLADSAWPKYQMNNANTGARPRVILQPPQITQQPQDTSVLSGQQATLSVTATGSAPLKYQWYLGNAGDTAQPVVGATAATFTTPTLTATIRLWVRVSNEAGTNDSTTATVTVIEVNHAPRFTKGANQTVNEDAGSRTVTGWASGLSPGATNESGQLLTFLVTTDHPELFDVQPAIDAAGMLTYRPATNAYGTATIGVILKDDGGTANGGQDTSAAQTFLITLQPVNDVPSFVKGANQVVTEDAGAQSVTGWATALSAGPTNESSQVLSFLVTTDHPELFAAQPAIDAVGTLTYTPAADAHGTATVRVVLKDNGGTANGGVDRATVQTFVITLLSANDAPTFVKGADQTVSENAGAQTVFGWASGISAGPDDEASQALTFLVASDRPELFAAQPAIDAAGTLTYTPATNAYGTATVSVVLRDDGTPPLSATNTFRVIVRQGNTPPTLAPIGLQTVQASVPWAMQLNGTDAETPTAQLVFRLLSAPGGVQLTASGLLTWTPSAAQAPATNTIVVQVADGGTPPLSATNQFTVVVHAASTDPRAARLDLLPQSIDIVEGDNGYLYCVAGGTPPLAYSWRKDGLLVTNADVPVLALTNAIPALAGTYTLEVSNGFGSTLSPPAVVRVVEGPSVFSGPQDLSVSLGGVLRLVAGATGTEPFTFQWRHNGMPIPSATNAVLEISPVTLGDGGAYTAVVGNPWGVVETAPALVTIREVGLLYLSDAYEQRPVFTSTQQLGWTNNLSATSEADEPFHAGKVGGKSLWMGWVAPAHGLVTFRTTGSSFDTLLAVYTAGPWTGIGSRKIASDEDRGGYLTSEVRFTAEAEQEYALAVDGYAGASGMVVISWVFEPMAESLPHIVSRSASQVVLLGTPTSLAVQATGSGLTYQWQRNGENLPGATGSQLDLGALTPAQAGTYTAGVTNSAGLGVLSADIVLEVALNVAGLGAVSQDKWADLVLPQGVKLQALAGGGYIGLALGQAGSRDTSSGSNTGQPGEGSLCGAMGGAGRWFWLRPEADGSLVLDTGGSEVLDEGGNALSVLLGVYEYRTGEPLVERECDSRGLDRSEVVVPVTRGQDLVVQLNTVGGKGTVRLNWNLAATAQTWSGWGLRDGRFWVVQPMPRGMWRLDTGENLERWTTIRQTNVHSGLLQYSEPFSTRVPNRIFRLQKTEGAGN